MATALWPTRAIASEMINVTDKMYWCLSTVAFNDFASTDISITPSNSQYMPLDNLRKVNSSLGTGQFYQDVIGVSNSTTVYLLATVSSGSLSRGQSFMVLPEFGSLAYRNDGQTSSSTSDIVPTAYKYFGRAGSTWYTLTPQNGLLVAPANLTFVVVAGNSRGAASANGFDFAQTVTMDLKVLVASAQPDVVTSIEYQTDDINGQIELQTEQQTEALMDTSGSDSVTSQQVTQGQQVFENLSFVTGVNQALLNMESAIVSQDVDTGVPFPGLQMAGFVIPAATIDPTSMMPEIMPYVRTVLTFVFCAAFISHIIHLVQAIFGIYEYGDMVLSDHVPDVGYTVSHSLKPDYSVDEDLGF